MSRRAGDNHKPLACPCELMQNQRQIKRFYWKNFLGDESERDAQTPHCIKDVPAEPGTAPLKIIRKINLLIFLEFYPLLLAKQNCGTSLGKLCGHRRFLA